MAGVKPQLVVWIAMVALVSSQMPRRRSGLEKELAAGARRLRGFFFFLAVMRAESVASGL